MTLTRRTLALATLAAPALAQARPITIVVAYPAGGDTDAGARIYAERLATRVGRPVVVENRSGASGAVGSIYVSRAAPDGDTLLLAPSTFPIVPHVLRAANYDPVRDFAPIILTASISLLLVANRQSGIRNLAEVRDAAQAGRVTAYGSPGSGSPMHIMAEMFNRAAGLQMTEVAYRGVAPIINDLLANNIQLGYVTPGAVMQHLQAGTMLPIAVADQARSPILPGTPTYAESGFDIIVPSWWGLYGPPTLPASMVETLNGHMNAVVRMTDVDERIRTMGCITAGGPPQALAEVTKADYERFGRVVRELNIRAE